MKSVQLLRRSCLGIPFGRVPPGVHLADPLGECVCESSYSGDKYLKETTLRRKCLFWLTGLGGSFQGHMVCYSVICAEKAEHRCGRM